MITYTDSFSPRIKIFINQWILYIKSLELLDHGSVPFHITLDTYATLPIPDNNISHVFGADHAASFVFDDQHMSECVIVSDFAQRASFIDWMAILTHEFGHYYYTYIVDSDLYETFFRPSYQATDRYKQAEDAFENVTDQLVDTFLKLGNPTWKNYSYAGASIARSHGHLELAKMLNQRNKLVYFNNSSEIFAYAFEYLILSQRPLWFKKAYTQKLDYYHPLNDAKDLRKSLSRTLDRWTIEHTY